MKKLWRALIAAATVLLLAGTYLSFGYFGKSSCEGIFQQSEQKLQADIEILKAKGGLLLGAETIQELTERSQLAALNFKGCCIAADNELIEKKQFLECKNTLANFQNQFDGLVAEVRDSSWDASSVQSQEAQAQRDAAAKLLRTAQASAGRLKRIASNPTRQAADAGQTPPPPPAGSESEPNDDFFSATAMVPGQTLDGEIQTNEDQDYFQFTYAGALRDWGKLRFENRSMTLAPHVSLYDSKKKLLSTNYENSQGADLDVNLVLEPGQNYFVRIPFYRGVGQYRLTIDPLKYYDAYEANDTADEATEVTIGVPVTAGILDQYDADWYRFTAVRDGEMQVRLLNQSKNLRPKLILYDTNKAQLTYEYNNTYGADLTLSFTATAGQNYFVQVPYYGTGTYTLSLE